MIARSQLAVLDFNCGVGLNQAVTKSGKLRYKQQSRHAIMGSQKDISIKREILHETFVTRGQICSQGE